MDQKAFDMIVKKTGEALAEQGFERQGDMRTDESGNWVLFTSESLAYSVIYRKTTKRYELRSCVMTDDGPDQKWKSLAVWLYDPEENTMGDADGIAADFVETIQGPKRVAALQSARKKTKKGDGENNNADPVFFYNRLVSVFPDIKEELNQERSIYGNVRAVKFAREHVLTRMNALPAGSGSFEKLAEIFNNQYINGDMDVRSIIIIVLLNGMDNQRVQEDIVPHFSDDLKKSYTAGLKFKGKTVKPEKKKKPKQYSTKLESLR